VLDEVDRMMAMGFIEDVETILKAEEGHQEKIQTFLFSATMPKWIKDLCNRFLKKVRGAVHWNVLDFRCEMVLQLEPFTICCIILPLSHRTTSSSTLLGTTSSRPLQQLCVT
jgi:hypothetical protein